MTSKKTSAEILSRVRNRRVNKLSKLLSPTKAWHNSGISGMIHLYDWLGDNSTGRFCANTQTIYFEKEEDAIVFNIGFKKK